MIRLQELELVFKQMNRNTKENIDGWKDRHGRSNSYLYYEWGVLPYGVGMIFVFNEWVSKWYKRDAYLCWKKWRHSMMTQKTKALKIVCHRFLSIQINQKCFHGFSSAFRYGPGLTWFSKVDLFNLVQFDRNFKLPTLWPVQNHLLMKE